MNGQGMMIWQLKNMPPPAELAAFVEYYGFDWVTIKLLEADQKYNQIGGADKGIIEYLKALAPVTKIGMWQFAYGYKPGPEGAAVGERFEKLEEHGLSFHMIDAEGGAWNQYGSNKKADLYMNSLNLPKRIPVYLNSYRYPKYFLQFPWFKFYKHERLTGVMPQVYWEFAHNPAYQLQRSLEEYRWVAAQAGGSEKPFYPVGSMYFRGVPGDPKGWGPTVADFEEFMAWVGNDVHSFYSLDKVLQHYDTYGYQWLKAVTGKDKMGSTPPPNPGSKFIEVREMEVTSAAVGGLWLHNQMSTSVSSRSGATYKGSRWYAEGLLEEVDGRIWAKIGVNQYACVRDRDGTQYMTWI